MNTRVTSLSSRLVKGRLQRRERRGSTAARARFSPAAHTCGSAAPAQRPKPQSASISGSARGLCARTAARRTTTVPRPLAAGGSRGHDPPPAAARPSRSRFPSAAAAGRAGGRSGAAATLHCCPRPQLPAPPPPARLSLSGRAAPGPSRAAGWAAPRLLPPRPAAREAYPLRRAPRRRPHSLEPAVHGHIAGPGGRSGVPRGRSPAPGGEETALSLRPGPA